MDPPKKAFTWKVSVYREVNKVGGRRKERDGREAITAYGSLPFNQFLVHRRIKQLSKLCLSIEWAPSLGIAGSLTLFQRVDWKTMPVRAPFPKPQIL